MNMERRCDYRNCGKDITRMRPNAKYCSRSCKVCESKYNKREDKKILEEKNHIVNLLNNINVSDDVVTLYNLINKK